MIYYYYILILFLFRITYNGDAIWKIPSYSATHSSYTANISNGCRTVPYPKDNLSDKVIIGSHDKRISFFWILFFHYNTYSILLGITDIENYPRNNILICYYQITSTQKDTDIKNEIFKNIIKNKNDNDVRTIIERPIGCSYATEDIDIKRYSEKMGGSDIPINKRIANFEIDFKSTSGNFHTKKISAMEIILLRTPVQHNGKELTGEVEIELKTGKIKNSDFDKSFKLSKWPESSVARGFIHGKKIIEAIEREKNKQKNDSRAEEDYNRDEYDVSPKKGRMN